MGRRLGLAPNVPKVKPLVNHLIYVIDSSGSMRPIWDKTIEALGKQLISWRDVGASENQECRVSLCTFNAIYTLRFGDMSIDDAVKTFADYLPLPIGNTALVSAVTSAISWSKNVAARRAATADVATLVTVLTDGQENQGGTPSEIRRAIPNDESFTVAILCPPGGRSFCEQAGFPAGNIQEWEATDSGIEDYTNSTIRAISTYSAARTRGVRGSSTYFTDLAAVTKKTIGALTPLSRREYKIIEVLKEGEIRECVEHASKAPYVLGNSYYELMKKERIQPQKDFIIMEKKSKQMYGGGSKIREFLGLPTTGDCRVEPGNHGDYTLFVQSTSTNRKVPRGTKILTLL